MRIVRKKIELNYAGLTLQYRRYYFGRVRAEVVTEHNYQRSNYHVVSVMINLSWQWTNKEIVTSYFQEGMKKHQNTLSREYGLTTDNSTHFYPYLFTCIQSMLFHKQDTYANGKSGLQNIFSAFSGFKASTKWKQALSRHLSQRKSK